MQNNYEDEEKDECEDRAENQVVEAKERGMREDFRREVRAVLGHVEELLENWETTATVIRETVRKVYVLWAEKGRQRGVAGIVRFRRVSRESD